MDNYILKKLGRMGTPFDLIDRWNKNGSERREPFDGE